MSITKAIAGLTAVAALAFASFAAAAPDALFANTLQITTADGAVLKVLVNADGTYSRTSAAGVVTGTWAETGDQMCFTPLKPEARPATCMPKITQGVGASWTITVGGKPATAAIVAGR